MGLSRTVIFSFVAGYFFGNFRDEAGIIMYLHAVRRRLIGDPKIHDLE